MPSAASRSLPYPVEDSDSQSDHHHSPTSPHGNSRPSGACVHCKSLKVRCDFSPGEKICQRCQAGGYECLPRSRKKRKPAPTHEDLQDRAFQQDCQIQELLTQLDKLKSESKISDWISRGSNFGAQTFPGQDDKSAVCAKQRSRWINTGTTPAEAAISFFPPGNGAGPLIPPDVVKFCSLFPEEILWLFDTYFEKIDPFFSLLDQELHTASNLIWTNHFLFTVICATAAKFYTARPELHQLCTDFAHDAAGQALVVGAKTLETVQAYMIIGVYPTPKRRWVQDRSWEFMGLAIRLALELDLPKPLPSAMASSREGLNRIRTWLNLLCVDSAHAVQFGKVPMLQVMDDYIARTCDEWYTTQINTPYDVHLTAYVKLLMIMSRWKVTVEEYGRGLLPTDFDIIEESIRTQEKLQTELDIWVARYNEELVYRPLLICSYRGTVTQMITAYMRLVVLAVGFQEATKNQLLKDSPILKLSLEVGLSVIQITVERLYPTGHFALAMDAQFLYVSFAAAYLLNLLRPRFLTYLDDFAVDEIVSNVRRLIGVLRSKKVALHGRHTPVLYAQFLESLLNTHSEVLLQRGTDPRTPRDSAYSPGNSRDHTPPGMFFWPDIGHSGHSSAQFPPEPSSGGDMDLSLLHFVKTVTQDFASQSFHQPQWPPPQTWGWDSREKNFGVWDTASWH